MEGLRTARRARNHKELLYKYRLPMLKNSYDTIVATFPVNSTYPGIMDVFVHPAIQEIIDLEPTVEVKESDFKLESLFPEITAQWKKSVEESLLDMIPDNCVPDGTEKSVNLFNLATIVFKCEICGHALLRYPEVMIHACASETRYNTGLPENPTLRTAEGKFLSVVWNTCGVIKFNKRAFKIVSEAVKMCGLDPITTTASQMDEGSPVFECTACNNERRGRATMGWDNLVCQIVKCYRVQTDNVAMAGHALGQKEKACIRGGWCAADVIRRERSKHYTQEDSGNERTRQSRGKVQRDDMHTL